MSSDAQTKEKDNENKIDGIVNIGTPSFIRLFVIRRIIDRYIKNNKNSNSKETAVLTIKELTNVFKDNKETQSLVVNILTRLINDGIKEYMNKWYNEKEQANIIEDIFCQIILKKFDKEYYRLIEYRTNSKIHLHDNFHQNLVFNSSDIMCKIFQHLEYGVLFDQDLFQCSLVNSHWLYHSWNTNSVHHVILDTLFSATSKYNISQDDHHDCDWITRLWQRLIHARSIFLYDGIDRFSSDSLVLNKLSMLTKCEKMDVELYTHDNATSDDSWSILMALMGKYKNRIKSCRTRILDYSGLEAQKLSSLKLPNAQHIEIGDIYFDRIWTNKCTSLKLRNINHCLAQSWCEFVIKNCDWSNINTLELDRVKFDESINESVLKQFASKLINLKQFNMRFVSTIDKNILLLWQSLKAIILNNNVKVELVLSLSGKENDEIISLNKIINKESLNCPMEKLDVQPFDNHDHDHNTTDEKIKLIQERDECGLNHLVIDAYALKTRLLDEVSFKSINVLGVLGRWYSKSTFSDINCFLASKKIVEKELFLIVDITINYNLNSDRDDGGDNNEDDDAIISLLKQLCQNISKLFIQRVPLDIKTSFSCSESNYETVLDKYSSMYTSYFENKQFFAEYDRPKCKKSHSCLPRIKPYTYFCTDEKYKSCMLRVTNVDCF